MKPIGPNEVTEIKSSRIPDVVIEAVNECIVKNWCDGQAIFTQDEVIKEIKRIAGKQTGFTNEEIYENKYLDFEPIFRKIGWIVEYDKPGYNETYEPNFTFKKAKKRRANHEVL